MVNKNRRDYQKIYQRAYRKKYRKRLHAQNKKNYEMVRKEVILYYSGGKAACAKCSHSDIRVLTIDHIDDDGSQHRKKLGASSIYAWLKKNNFPSGFQVLCHNCNWLKERIKHLTSKDFLLEDEIGEL